MRDKVKRNFVCVKIIKIKNIPKKEREATKMEVDLLKRLHHPNIVGYIDSFLSKNNESLCICMEYCDGGDLASQIKAARKNLFSESKILHWFVQLALGLQYMHSHKVLHRDLKTQNVFLLGNGRLVLGDLGISKVLDGTMDFAQTCIGTPYYMSPEIFQNKPYSYKSDVWALGCVLYEMTTLNHAFDANSLNGLATKIVKGKYPPIHAKYSRYLRELIGQMLMINPQLRPDVDQILRKSFIKKHIVNFFVDIASRPSTSIGEGTMVFKAAAGGAINGNVNDSSMISLRQQLQALDMTESVAEAMRPKNSPQDDEEAIKLAREQAGALKREQEHKKMVEAALEKLRIEREIRAKQRSMEPIKKNPTSNSNFPPSARREDLGPKRQSNNPPQPSQLAVNRNPVEVPKKDVRDVANRDRERVRRAEEMASVPKSEDVGVGRRRTFGEEKERLDREKKIADERKRNSLEQEAAKARAEDRRREEVRAEARAREEARLREEAKLREEQAERMRMEQVRERAEQAAKAKREAQRERERERQREEIDQLKRDKLELDRRTTERERLREERRAEERSRLENVRRDQMDAVQYKLDNMNDQIQKLDLLRNRPNDERNDDFLSAREKLHKKQDRSSKEEFDGRDVEQERRIRAQQEFRSKANDYNDQPNLETPRYEFDGVNRRSTKSKVDAEDLHDRLEEATRGKQSRFDVESGSERRSVGLSNKSKANNGLIMEEGSDSGTDEDIWEKGNGESNLEEEEEDLHRREEELRAELNFATLRVEELRRTLQETKSFLGPRLPTRQSRDTRVTGGQPKEVNEDDDDDDEEDLYELEEADELEESCEDNLKLRLKGISSNINDEANFDDASNGDKTIRRIKLPEAAVAYTENSPSGKLSDRIERLRQRCMEALGRDAFLEAYNFLKQHELDSQGFDNGRDLNEDAYEAKKVTRIRAILGEGKAHYMSLIDQLIFMEGAERE